MNKTLLAGATLLTGLTFACSGGPGGTTSSSSSSGGSSSSSSGGGAGDFYKSTLLPAQCAYEERCKADRGQGYSTVAACNAQLDQFDALYANILGKGVIALFNENYTVDPAAAQACATNLAAASCTADDAVEVAGCNSAVRPKNAIAAGGDCTSLASETGFSGRACDTGLSCRSSASDSQCSKCILPKADGAACTDSNECDSYQCTGGTCAAQTAPALRNQPCQSSCLGNLSCAGPNGATTCQERLGVGATCTVAPGARAPDCQRDLVCNETTGKCAAPLANGQACDVQSPVPCAGACRFATADLTGGMCGDIAPAPTTGQPCAMASLGEGIPVCAFGSSPNITMTGMSYSCVCGSPKAAGAACVQDLECANQNCRNHVCLAPHAVGASCNGSRDCSSGVCDYSAMGGAKCVAAPMCM